MSTDPLVSIVVPNYNHRRYLPERLDSIRAQTFTDYERILLDDASTDGSAEYLKQLANEPDTRVILNDTNSGGPFAQWNKGVELARGQFVWLAESDDVARPEFLATLVPLLRANPQLALAETVSRRIDADGNDCGPLPRSEHPQLRDRWDRDYLADGLPEIRETMYVQNAIPSASAVLFRRQAYLNAGLADETLSLGGDWLQWVKLLTQGGRFFSASPLSMSRVHPDTQRARTATNGRYELESLRVQQRIAQLVPISRQLRRAGTERYLAVRLHSVRSGQFSGTIVDHLNFLAQLSRLDVVSALRFRLQLPYCATIGFVKRRLGRTG